MLMPCYVFQSVFSLIILQLISLFNRSGRFILQSPKNILPPSALLDWEEALNKGSNTATEVFSSLRTRSILHLLVSTGSFFGLKVVNCLDHIVMSLLLNFISRCSIIIPLYLREYHCGMRAVALLPL